MSDETVTNPAGEIPETAPRDNETVTEVTVERGYDEAWSTDPDVLAKRFKLPDTWGDVRTALREAADWLIETGHGQAGRGLVEWTDTHYPAL